MLEDRMKAAARIIENVQYAGKIVGLGPVGNKQEVLHFGPPTSETFDEIDRISKLNGIEKQDVTIVAVPHLELESFDPSLRTYTQE